jgi:hypothetical protein
VTRHRSVLMSDSRLKLALASGLDVANWTFDKWSHAESVCSYSLEPQQVMTLLRVHGVPWHVTLCAVAAYNSNLSLLQWLRASSCPWYEELVLTLAGNSVPSAAMLQWLQTVTAPWSADMKSTMLNKAGLADNLATAQWLLAQGADWPAAFAEPVLAGSSIKQCWGLAAVQWAVASGSGWLDWRCETYADGNFTSSAKKRAPAVLQWAHANDCPCTCGHQQQQQQQR